MTTKNWDTFGFTDYLNVKNKEINGLPTGLLVSTMCASCKLNTRLDIPTIEKYLQLNQDDILKVKFSEERIRTLIKAKKKTSRAKRNTTVVKPKGKNHFYNQITVVVRVNEGKTDNLINMPKINMKLFKNGSVQMSGCKSLYNINRALNKLIERLKEVKAKIENGVLSEIKFIENADDITVKDFKIDMINSNYKVNMQIDREKLFILLQKKKIKSSFEPCIRSCVIIKFVPNIENPDGKEVSVFVFQKGNIIITGARCKEHITLAYNYINEILSNHTEEILKNDETEEEDIILEIYRGIEKEIKAGLIKITN